MSTHPESVDERPEWITCETLRPFVLGSLRASAAELRAKESWCRTAYQHERMGVATRYIADVYAEAASTFEEKLATLSVQQGDA